MSNSGTHNCLMAMTDKIDMEDQDRECLDLVDWECPECLDSHRDMVTNLDLHPDTVDQDMVTNLGSHPDTVDQGRVTNLGSRLDTVDRGRVTNLGSHPDTVDQGRVTNLGSRLDTADQEDRQDNSTATKHQHHLRRIWRRRTQVASCLL